MDLIYNKEAFKLFLGAILTIIVIVGVRYVISRRDYIKKRQEIKDEIDAEPEKESEYGNVDEYLKNKKITTVSIPEQLIENVLHPLTVVILINLFDEHTTFSSVVTLIVFLFSIYHEMLGIEDSGKNKYYRWFIFVLWLFTYVAITDQYNRNEEKARIEEKVRIIGEINSKQQHPIIETHNYPADSPK